MRNHIPRSPHYDLVTDTQAEALNLILIVQSGITHRHATDKHGVEPSHWGNGTSATHLKLHIKQACARLFSGKFTRYRPTRCPGDETQNLLQTKTIDLVDNAVDVIGQIRAQLCQTLEVINTGLDTDH